MGLSDVLNSARDAMSAQTFGITVTGQNVANVNTPGYVRRQAQLETRDMGPGSFGGVQAAGIRRVADRFVDQRQLALTGQTGEASTRDQLLGQAEALFNDFGGTGLGTSLNALFSSFSALAASPTDLTTRSTVLQNAQTFSEQVRTASTQLQNFRTDLFAQARELTNQVNSKLDTISELSGRINQAHDTGEEAADLEDKRDSALAELGNMVEIHTYTDGNGQLVVQGPGVTLMQGDISRHLSIDMGDDGKLKVLANNKDGPSSSGNDITAFLSAGQLSGVLTVRDHDVVSMQSDLDAFAFNVGNQINSVHAAGFGLDGSGGRDLFTVGATQAGAAAALGLNAAMEDHPELLGASSSPGEVPGNATQATALAKLGSTPIAALGDLDPGQAYARIVGSVGQRKADAAATLDTRQAMSDQVETMRQSISGVSLDEEMVSLSKYQRAFQAASRVFTTADQMLEELLNTVGR